MRDTNVYIHDGSIILVNDRNDTFEPPAVASFQLYVLG